MAHITTRNGSAKPHSICWAHPRTYMSMSCLMCSGSSPTAAERSRCSSCNFSFLNDRLTLDLHRARIAAGHFKSPLNTTWTIPVLGAAPYRSAQPLQSLPHSCAVCAVSGCGLEHRMRARSIPRIAKVCVGVGWERLRQIGNVRWRIYLMRSAMELRNVNNAVCATARASS